MLMSSCGGPRRIRHHGRSSRRRHGNSRDLRESDESLVDPSDALKAWVLVGRSALERTARTYRATITYKDLAEEVQSVSGIRTKRLLQHWIGHVLGAVSNGCHAAGEPLLSSLCVRADGTVGPGYAIAVVDNLGGEPPDDLDMHAAIERLNCYRHFGAVLPEDGGSPALTQQVAAARNRKQRQTSPRSRHGRFVRRAISCCPYPGSATTVHRIMRPRHRIPHRCQGP